MEITFKDNLVVLVIIKIWDYSNNPYKFHNHI
jgi:hypothetical protein